MNILIVAGLFYPAHVGGPANTLYWLAKGLQSKGLNVTVVTSSMYIEDRQIEFNKWQFIDNLKVRYCIGYSKFPLRLVWNAIIKIGKVDTLILSSICYLPNFPIAIMARLLHKKIIWSPRGELLESALKGNKKKLFYFKILKKILGTYVTYHATSLEEKRSIQNIFNGIKCITIPNYIKMPKCQLREKLSQRYFLYVGRIAPIKALDKLILGLSKSINFMKSNTIFKIIGGVESQFENYYDELLKLVQTYHLEGKIVFEGPLFGHDKYKCYANAEYTFLVSNSENFGNVVLESLSQGTPVVTSKGTPWAKIEEYGAGFWIDNSVNELTNIINYLFQLSDCDYLKMRNCALALSSTYDIYKNVDNWLGVLNDVK